MDKRREARFNTAAELAEFEHVVFDVTHWSRRGDVGTLWEQLRHAVVHVHLANDSAQSSRIR